MNDLENHIIEPRVDISKTFLLLLTIIAVTASLVGVIIILNIFSSAEGISIFYFSRGLFLGFLLLLSGTILLVGVIILERASNRDK